MSDPYSQAASIANAWSGVGRNMFQGQANFERGKMDAATKLAQQFALESQGRLNQEKAMNEQQRRGYQTPEFGSKIAEAMVGLPAGAGSEIEQFQQRGNWGMNPEQPLPMDQSGPPRPEMPKAAPNWYKPEIEQRFNMARGAQMLGLGGTGNSDANNMADAYAKLLGQGRIDNAIANPVQAANFARAMAASKGDALFNQGSNGVMEKFTGQETLNAVGRSAAAENSAQAGNASASAALHRAQIPEVQARIELTRSKIGAPQVINNLDGSQSVIYPNAKPEKPLTESQAKATAFLGQMTSAEDLLSSLEKDQSKLGQQADVRMAGGPLNFAASPKAQQIGQAQNQWSEAFLRFKTGAAATPDEVRLNNVTFFPQIGDSKEVVAQKAMMRKQAANDMRTVAGAGAGKVGSVYANAKTAAPPKIQRGEVVDGYRFKGGNPADQANWEPAK